MIGSKPKDTPNYSQDDVMNSTNLGLSEIRSRNLRKAEAAKKQIAAQKALSNSSSTASPLSASSCDTATEHVVRSEETCPLFPNANATIKKKQYSIRLDSDNPTLGKVDNNASNNALDVLDPAEHAKQERLRKQKEKQVT